MTAREVIAVFGERDGATPPDNLSDYDGPVMVVVIPFAVPVTRAAAE